MGTRVTEHTRNKTRKGVRKPFIALLIAGFLALVAGVGILAPNSANDSIEPNSYSIGTLNPPPSSTGDTIDIIMASVNDITCIQFIDLPRTKNSIKGVSYPLYNFAFNLNCGPLFKIVNIDPSLVLRESDYIPFEDIHTFGAYGDYSINVSIHYWDGVNSDNGIYLETILLNFTHSPSLSEDSNVLDICIGQYVAPTLSIKDSGIITLSGGNSFGDSYTLNIGDYAANIITATVTNPWTATNFSLDNEELVKDLTHGIVYDVWATSNGKNLYKNSEKSEALRFTVYDDISLSFSGSRITWGEVNNVHSYKVNLNCDGEWISKTVTGNSIEFNDFNIINGLCYVTLEVASENLMLSKSNSIVIKLSQLAAPVIRVEGENLVWDFVRGANGYRVFYNDTFFDTMNTFVSLMSLGLDLGNYNLKVRAIGNLENKESLTVRTVSTYLTQMVAINYSVDGDLSQKLVEYGSALNLPAIEKTGKTFEGWFYDKEFTQKANDGETVKNNLVLYAKFADAEPVKLSFWANVWKTAKPILIWSGVALGAVLVIFVTVKIVKKVRG